MSCRRKWRFPSSRPTVSGGTSHGLTSPVERNQLSLKGWSNLTVNGWAHGYVRACALCVLVWVACALCVLVWVACALCVLVWVGGHPCVFVVWACVFVGGWVWEPTVCVCMQACICGWVGLNVMNARGGGGGLNVMNACIRMPLYAPLTLMKWGAKHNLFRYVYKCKKHHISPLQPDYIRLNYATKNALLIYCQDNLLQYSVKFRKGGLKKHKALFWVWLSVKGGIV